jgi:peptidyl-prolyl cis-trans isomerase C
MKRTTLFLTIILVGIMSACNPPAGGTTPTQQPPAATLTPAPPTPTPAPLAFTVNGEGYLLQDYEEEMVRLKAAQAETGQTLSDEAARALIIKTITDEMLLAQGAHQAGFTLDEAGVQARIAELAGKAGGEAALADYMAANHYSPECFARAIKRQAEVAWQRDQLAAGVPETADQIHARQILLRSQTRIQAAYDELQTGTDFAKVAGWYDPLTAGDLGWFPRGTLTQPAVEEAVFALEVGQYSSIIQTDFGYHIIYVVERDAARVLAPDIRRRMQTEAVNQWLEQQRSSSIVNILLP